MIEDNILEINHLSLWIAKENNREQIIIDDLSFQVPKKKITCLVGESGSGKSMTIASILGQIPELAYFSKNSSIIFNGESIYSVFQDPMNSLNPGVKIKKQLYGMIRGYHFKMTDEIFQKKLIKILEQMHFEDPQLVLNQYPFELSGGMLQRVMIGCGILIEPSLMIADEPTTALDVTVQKEILREFQSINKNLDVTLLVVTHDFGVVAEIADKVIVMEKGKIVEIGNVFQVFDHPKEAYTKALIQATFKEKSDVDDH